MEKICVLNQPVDVNEKIWKRIKNLKCNILSNKQSIRRMQGFASDKLTLKNKGYTAEAERYKRTLDDERRLPKTIHNLEFQIALMEKEIQILEEFRG